ncbi:DUF2922 domain-containing protein [Pediococcus stilesii]|uniref:DUF2922 domain-containing protein n=1 Tax=Pediococcus stilesii TaxID=331679 RepID=A0A5R9BZ49_9LACO|nr:DUF2922 domain-containing protein [Pediococcus stilesii]TLQ05152.1 DUF2922 domain-containing protein [Pediococcus stilesii]
MKQLDLEFTNANGKIQHFKAQYVKQNLDEATVRQVMEKISASNLFQKEEGNLYATPKSAQYVETIHEPIFSDEQK